MKRIVAFTLMILFAFSLCACKSDNGADNNSSTDNSVAISADAIKISTPYLDLQLKKSIAENVTYKVTNKNPYTLTFKAKKDGTKLFSLIFDGTGDDLLGTIIGEDKNTVLYVNMFELDNKSEDYQEYTSYQMGVNDILNRLSKDSSFISGEIVEDEDKSTFDINTDIVTLKYPNKWKDKVDIDVSDKAVMFSFKGVKVFDIYFGEVEDGSLIGTYNQTPIFVLSYLPDNSKLSDEELSEYSEMQYDVNRIINNLKKDKKFKSS